MPPTDWLESPPPDLTYVGLLFALFVVPRVLARYRIPAALTAFGLGAGSGMGLGLFVEDHTVHLLSVFGITSLFLFAGLDVDPSLLRRQARVLAAHVGIHCALLAAVAVAATYLVGLDPRAATLVALGLVIPSTGFILDTLGGLGLNEEERAWVRGKAIATELMALAVLFVALQSTTAARMALSTAALLAIIGLLPLAFRLFAAVIVPHAPRSEFAFLMIVAVVCAFATRRLGVYYLVGAFVVGMTAQRFRERLPAMASEKMLHAVESFSSLFVPFYFFHAGLRLRPEDLHLGALLAGAAFVALALPVRLLVVGAHRRLALHEPWRRSLRVSVPMLPTLVFTLVMVELLRERYPVPGWLLGGLVLYTIIDTLAPGLWLRPKTAAVAEPPVEDPLADEERPRATAP